MLFLEKGRNLHPAPLFGHFRSRRLLLVEIFTVIDCLLILILTMIKEVMAFFRIPVAPGQFRVTTAAGLTEAPGPPYQEADLFRLQLEKVALIRAYWVFLTFLSLAAHLEVPEVLFLKLLMLVVSESFHDLISARRLFHQMELPSRAAVRSAPNLAGSYFTLATSAKSRSNGRSL
jgi:hypothetical protein